MGTGIEARLMKEPEARAYLGGMSHGAFFRLRQDRLLRHIKIGASVYWDRDDLDRFIDGLREEA